MSDSFDYGMAVGIEKVARVPRAVKQYRRAIQMLSRRGRDSHLFHASQEQYMKGILDKGVRQHPGAHGHGAYFWKRQPLQTNLGRSDAVGIAIPETKMPPGRESNFVSRMIDPHREHMRVWTGMGKEDLVKVPRGSTAFVTDTQRRALGSQMASGRIRQIDPAIFHRAEADWRAGVHGAGVRTPSKKELVALLKRKVKPKDFKKMRAATEEGIDDFIEGYERLVH